MTKNEIFQLSFLEKQIRKFVGENLPDKKVGEYILDLLKQDGYSSTLLEIKTNSASIVTINEYNVDDAMMDYHKEVESDEYLELGIKYEGQEEINTYNDVAGFIIKDNVLYTVYELEETFVTHIIVVYTGIEEIYNMSEIIKSFNFKNVKIIR